MPAPAVALARRTRSQEPRHRMQLILLSKERGHLGQVRLDSGRAWLSVVAGRCVVCCRACSTAASRPRRSSASAIRRLRSTPGAAELAQQQSIVDTTRRALQQNLDALAAAPRPNERPRRPPRRARRAPHRRWRASRTASSISTRRPPLGGPGRAAGRHRIHRRSPASSARSTCLDEQIEDRDRQLTRARRA